MTVFSRIVRRLLGAVAVAKEAILEKCFSLDGERVGGMGVFFYRKWTGMHSGWEVGNSGGLAGGLRGESGHELLHFRPRARFSLAHLRSSP